MATMAAVGIKSNSVRVSAKDGLSWVWSYTIPAAIDGLVWEMRFYSTGFSFPYLSLLSFSSPHFAQNQNANIRFHPRKKPHQHLSIVELKEGAYGLAAVSVHEGSEITRDFGIGRLAHQAIDPQSVTFAGQMKVWLGEYYVY